ncbi:MAG: hypothetical protein GF421_10195 [Candidatus Aminicenantes bacterium]|nr:hypothetical protein [Candidatus Aminicenantes bacterium]
MGLTKKQEELYRQTMQEAKAQLDTIDEEMENEIQKAREKLERLKEAKESFRQLYEGAARLLGEEIKLDQDDGESDQATPQINEPQQKKEEESSQKKEDSSEDINSDHNSK